MLEDEISVCPGDLIKSNCVEKCLPICQNFIEYPTPSLIGAFEPGCGCSNKNDVQLSTNKCINASSLECGGSYERAPPTHHCGNNRIDLLGK